MSHAFRWSAERVLTYEYLESQMNTLRYLETQHERQIPTCSISCQHDGGGNSPDKLAFVRLHGFDCQEWLLVCTKDLCTTETG